MEEAKELLRYAMKGTWIGTPLKPYSGNRIIKFESCKKLEKIVDEISKIMVEELEASLPAHAPSSALC